MTTIKMINQSYFVIRYIFTVFSNANFKIKDKTCKIAGMFISL